MMRECRLAGDTRMSRSAGRGYSADGGAGGHRRSRHPGGQAHSGLWVAEACGRPVLANAPAPPGKATGKSCIPLAADGPRAWPREPAQPDHPSSASLGRS